MNNFKLNRVLEDCFELKITSDTLFYKSQKQDYKLHEITKNTFEIKWRSLERVTYYSVNEKYVFFNSQNKETWVIKKDHRELYYKIPLALSFNDKTSSSYLFVGNSKKGICILDYSSNSYREYETDDSVVVVEGYKVFCINSRNDKVIAYDNLFSTLWQFDITQFGTYKERKIFADKEPDDRQREIKRIYYQQDKIIVSLSGAVIALSPETGKLLWKIDFEDYTPVEIVFDGNTGYVGERLYFAIIDIEKGIKKFESEFDHDIEIEDRIIRWVNSGSGLVFHKDFLWCVFNEKGNNYLVKLNPNNGKLIEGMRLETQAPSTRPPVFDKNRMYILDQEGFLFIYEEQV